MAPLAGAGSVGSGAGVRDGDSEVIRGHRSRPGVGGPNNAVRVGVMSQDNHFEHQLPRASLTSLVTDVRCEGCLWPETCAGDRTCWKAEPSSFKFTGQLQARAANAARRDPWTRAEVIEALLVFAKAHGGLAPTVEDYKSHSSLPPVGAMYRHFMTNMDAAKAAGLEPRKRWGTHRKGGKPW